MYMIVPAVILVLLIIAVRVLAVYCEREPEYPYELYSSPRDLNLKSGDLLLMRNFNMPYGLKFMGDSFGHVAMVYQDSRTGYMYILENCSDEWPEDFFGNRKNGPRITPLWTRLRSYDGRVCVKRLAHPLTEEQVERFDQLVDDYLTREYAVGKVPYVLTCVLGLDIDYRGPTNCGSFIAQVVSDLDVVRTHRAHTCMRPQIFYSLHEYAKPGTNEYMPLVELKFNKRE